MIGTIGAYVTAWLASRWLSWLGTAAGWVWWAVTTTIKGIFSFLQDPRELFAVCIIAITVFGLGAFAMWSFVGHRVKTVEAQMTALWQDMSKKDREDARKAAEARAARVAAEAAERQRQINEANTAKLPPLAVVAPAAPSGTAVSSHPPVVAGVRVDKPKVRRRKSEPSLLDSIQAAFSGSDGAGAR
jgi:type VI protein secretion system component VasK